jgi:fructose-bisphosphate aldolase class I
MSSSEMESTIRSLLATGKVMFAEDESLGATGNLFQNTSPTSIEESRRKYCQLLFTTPKLGQFISGAILSDETIRQRDPEGVPFVEILKRQGIIPGTRVDLDAKRMAGLSAEMTSEALEGLRARFAEYYQLGARFSSLRAVISIGERISTDAGIAANSLALAHYAACSQEAGLVPVVELEVSMRGDHTIETAEAVIQRTLHRVLGTLLEQRVVLELTLLKSGMVFSGDECPQQTGVQEVARATIRCLRRAVVPAIPGIFLLPSGQSEVQAAQRFNAINQLGPQPWQLSFCFAGALRAHTLQTSAGDPAKAIEAQKALLRRARANAAAREGKYRPELETAPISLLPSPTAL